MGESQERREVLVGQAQHLLRTCDSRSPCPSSSTCHRAMRDGAGLLTPPEFLLAVRGRLGSVMGRRLRCGRLPACLRLRASSRPPGGRCSHEGTGSVNDRSSRCCACPTRTSPRSWRSPTRCGCAGAAPRSRSRASCRSRPAAAPRTATSARSRACSRRPCAPRGWTSRRWSQAAVETAATGATEFCIVAAVRGPDERLMTQMREGVAAIREAVDINVAASLGMLTQEQVDELADMGVHRYNHNLETARSYFPHVVTTHTLGGALGDPDDGARRRHGGLLRRHRRHGRDARAARRVRRAAGRARARRGAAELPQPAARHAVRRPAGDVDGPEALRTIAAFRLALPRTILRYAGGREITLGDLGTRDGMLGGINAVIVGNYLTTLGRAPGDDLALLGELGMPIKALLRDALRTGARASPTKSPRLGSDPREAGTTSGGRIPCAQEAGHGRLRARSTPRQTRLLSSEARPSAPAPRPQPVELAAARAAGGDALPAASTTSIDPDAVRHPVLLLVPDGRDRRSASS